MKKVISLALAAVICSASMLLAACGGNAGTATKDETPANTKTIATVDDLEGAKSAFSSAQQATFMQVITRKRVQR